jgi:hypothetical protein
MDSLLFPASREKVLYLDRRSGHSTPQEQGSCMVALCSTIDGRTWQNACIAVATFGDADADADANHPEAGWHQRRLLVKYESEGRYRPGNSARYCEVKALAHDDVIEEILIIIINKNNNSSTDGGRPSKVRFHRNGRGNENRSASNQEIKIIPEDWVDTVGGGGRTTRT